MTLQIEKIKSNEGIIADVLNLIEQLNRPVTFRDLMIRLPDSVSAQNVWDTLRYLQEMKMIESVKISNRKIKWKLQYGYIHQTRQ